MDITYTVTKFPATTPYSKDEFGNIAQRYLPVRMRPVINSTRSLTAEQVRQVRRRWRMHGETYAAIGRDYGLDGSAISKIVNHETYRDVRDVTRNQRTERDR